MTETIFYSQAGPYNPTSNPCILLSMESFSSRVWELALSIPFGRVTTYGALAKAAGGGAMAARSITSILSKAPNHRAIPFHRIVYANGKVWMNEEYEKKRRAAYKKEGIKITKSGSIENFEEIFFDFTEL